LAPQVQKRAPGGEKRSRTIKSPERSRLTEEYKASKGKKPEKTMKRERLGRRSLHRTENTRGTRKINPGKKGLGGKKKGLQSTQENPVKKIGCWVYA